MAIPQVPRSWSFGPTSPEAGPGDPGTECRQRGSSPTQVLHNDEVGSDFSEESDCDHDMVRQRRSPSFDCDRDDNTMSDTAEPEHAPANLVEVPPTQMVEAGSSESLENLSAEIADKDAKVPQDFSALPLKELKRRLREADITIPASAIEKSDLVALLQQACMDVAKPGANPLHTYHEAAEDASVHHGECPLTQVVEAGWPPTQVVEAGNPEFLQKRADDASPHGEGVPQVVEASRACDSETLPMPGLWRGGPLSPHSLEHQAASRASASPLPAPRDVERHPSPGTSMQAYTMQSETQGDSVPPKPMAPAESPQPAAASPAPAASPRPTSPKFQAELGPDLDKADRLKRELLQARMEFLGPDHPQTIRLQKVLEGMQEGAANAAQKDSESSGNDSTPVQPDEQLAEPQPSSLTEAATTPARRSEAPPSRVAGEAPCASAEKTRAAVPGTAASSSGSGGGSSSQHLVATGHTLQPLQQGQRVAVIGDGWGGGEEGYEAVVTEADNFTFTVIAVSGKEVWKEFHVLRKQCIPLGPLALQGAVSRPASMVASPHKATSAGKKKHSATPKATPKASPKSAGGGSAGRKRRSSSAASPAASPAGSGRKQSAQPRTAAIGAKKQRASR